MNIKIVPAQKIHLPFIAQNMREADVIELKAFSGHTPLDALECSLARSISAWTCFVNNSPAFVWGVAPAGSILSKVGMPWLLGTPDIYKIKFRFVKESKQYVNYMAAKFLVLENYVHTKNEFSKRWLKWCGFTIEKEAKAYGIDKSELFNKFYMQL